MPKASAARDQREQQAFGEQLPDDAAPRRANRQPDADLALAGDPAREQQVGDVRAPDHQDQAERKKERHEQQHRVGRQRDRALPRFEHEARAAARRNVRPHAARVPHEELRERLVARQTGLQPADDVEADGSLRVPAGRGGTGQGARAAPRSPAPRRPRALESLPASRRQPGTTRRSPGPCGRARRGRPQVLGPGPMAEDNDRRAARFVVRGRERAPTLGADAEDAGRSFP